MSLKYFNMTLQFDLANKTKGYKIYNNLGSTFLQLKY